MPPANFLPATNDAGWPTAFGASARESETSQSPPASSFGTRTSARLDVAAETWAGLPSNSTLSVLASSGESFANSIDTSPPEIPAGGSTRSMWARVVICLNRAYIVTTRRALVGLGPCCFLLSSSPPLRLCGERLFPKTPRRDAENAELTQRRNQTDPNAQAPCYNPSPSQTVQR